MSTVLQQSIPSVTFSGINYRVVLFTDPIQSSDFLLAERPVEQNASLDLYLLSSEPEDLFFSSRRNQIISMAVPSYLMLVAPVIAGALMQQYPAAYQTIEYFGGYRVPVLGRVRSCCLDIVEPQEMLDPRLVRTKLIANLERIIT